ncbi:MAG TPA: cupin domain-containing protein [Gemmatimonadaceae bacterium]
MTPRSESQPTTTVEPITVHADARGVVVEPATPEMLPAQRNVHLVTSAPGAVRGNHYHDRGTEVAVLVGPALVRLREEGVVRDVEVPAGEAWRFTIPPRVSHAFQNTGKDLLVLVAFNTVEHDPAAPDVVRDVLIEPPA